jgi:hypothetical protein
MYSIFVHLSGIAILEICFFFYYVGPMETTMFENTVKKLTNEPSVNLNIAMVEMPDLKLDLQKFIYIAFNSGNGQLNLNEDTNATTDDYSDKNRDKMLRELEELRDYGIERRNEHNHDLFIQTLEYWSMLCAFTLLVCIIEYICSKKKKVGGVIMVSSDDETTGLELGEGPYRKGSIDECSDDSLIHQQEQITCIDKCCNTCKHKCNKKCMKRTMYYISFGCCLLTFQYLFFQNVVYYYNPLSLEEVKYLIYIAFMSQIPAVI